MTTGAGYFLASRHPLNVVGLLNTLLRTLLVTSGTAILNHWMERAEAPRCAAAPSGLALRMCARRRCILV